LRRGLGGLGVKKSSSDVRIDWRIVDCFNRKVIKTGQSVGTQRPGWDSISAPGLMVTAVTLVSATTNS